MKVTPFNLIYHDLVGLRTKVVSSTDPTQIDLDGVVVDETAKLLVLSIEGVNKKIPKKNATFTFYIPQPVTIEGSRISYSPAERLKRLQRRH